MSWLPGEHPVHRCPLLSFLASVPSNRTDLLVPASQCIRQKSNDRLPDTRSAAEPMLSSQRTVLLSPGFARDRTPGEIGCKVDITQASGCLVPQRRTLLWGHGHPLVFSISAVRLRTGVDHGRNGAFIFFCAANQIRPWMSPDLLYEVAMTILTSGYTGKVRPLASLEGNRYAAGSGV